MAACVRQRVVQRDWLQLMRLLQKRRVFSLVQLKPELLHQRLPS